MTLKKVLSQAFFTGFPLGTGLLSRRIFSVPECEPRLGGLREATRLVLAG